MNARLLAQALAIVERALGEPTGARPAFVEAACGANAELRREVESLLEAAMQADNASKEHARRLCPTCHRLYRDGVGYCPSDGQALEELLTGRTLDGVLEVQELLGLGGMGAVYRAYHRELNDTVVVKTIHRDLAANRSFVERFQKEGQAARKIDHKNAVRVYDLRTSTSPVYMVMEFVGGRTLRADLDERRRYTPAEVVELLAPVAEAVDAAHAVGIVHRDLKPDNIMLERGSDGISRVKVLDFGIAKMLDSNADSSLTMVGQPIGTARYMPPEQWGVFPDDDGPPIDGRADVYSLGCIAYELVTGRTPFDSRASGYAYIAELKRGHCTATPPPIETPDVASAFARAIYRALAKERVERQTTPRNFLAELEASLGSGKQNEKTAEATPADAGSRANPEGREAVPARSWRPARWVVGASALLIAILTAAVLWSLSGKTVSAGEVATGRISDQSASVPAGNGRDDRIYDAEYSFPTGPAPTGKVYATIGFTVWRSRPASARDGEDAARETIDSQEMTAERVGETIADGDRVYLCVESLTDAFMPDNGGYLYVINREQYSDGSFGPARLIFPTALTYGGGNRVKPGLPIVLPGADRPFTIKRSGPTHVAESYLIILSPWEFRLPAPLGPKAMALPEGVVDDWNQRYNGKMYRASLREGLGHLRSRREQAVTSRSTVDTAEPLTQTDPLPQTCYKGAVKIGDPAMLTVSLSFK